MRKILHQVIALAVVAVTFATTELAAQTLDPAQLDQFLARLELTESQKTAARPVIVTGLKERLGILKSAGFKKGEKPSIFDLMKIRKPIRDSRNRTENQLSQILDPAQMSAYRQFTEEASDRFLAGLQQ